MAFRGFTLTHDFGDAAAEARICRTDCALFDFSFLECALLEGDCARSVIETFTGRSMVALGQNEILYALRAGVSGGIAADWTVWRTGSEFVRGDERAPRGCRGFAGVCGSGR